MTADLLQKLQDEALDRMRSAGTQLELDKAKAIADFAQWLIERGDVC